MSYKSPALRQVTVLEVTWSDCPENVVGDVREMWINYAYGNDNFYHNWEPDPVLDEKYPHLTAYLKEHNISSCLIHYWW